MYKNMIKQLVKKAAGKEQRIDRITATNITLTNVGLLKNAVQEVAGLFGQGITMTNDGDFFPEARDQWVNYQAIIYSSKGSRIIPRITTDFTENNFMFCFEDQEVYSEDIFDTKKTVLGLNGLVRGNTIKTNLNGGWFKTRNQIGEDELCFAIVTLKPQNVLNRYTMMRGTELGMQEADPPVQNDPATLYYPVTVMDEYTRANYHYPQIIAREFYAAVVAKYCTQPLDKYVLNKTEYNARTPRPREADEIKQYRLAAQAFEASEINLRNVKAVYNLQLPFIIQQTATAINAKITGSNGASINLLTDISADETLYSDLSEEALEPIAYDEAAPEIDTTQLESDLAQANQSLEMMLSDPTQYQAEIIAARSEIDRIQGEIDSAQAVGGGAAIPVVFTAGQPPAQALAGTRAREARTPARQAAINNRMTTMTNNARSPLIQKQIRMNISSYWDKSVAVNYRLADAPQQTIASEFPVENQRPTHALSIGFNLGGNVIYIPPPAGGPAGRIEVRDGEVPKTSAVFEPYKIEKVSRPVEVAEEIGLFFSDALNSPIRKDAGKLISTISTTDYRSDPNSIRNRYKNDRVNIENSIDKIEADSEKYDFDIFTSRPQEWKLDENGKSVMKKPLEYIIDLDAYLSRLEIVTPKSLSFLEEQLSKGHAISEADLSIVRIILEKS